MVARVFTFQFRPDPILEAQMEMFSLERMPVMREQQGFIKMYQLLDRTSGKGMQMNLWETDADLLAYLNGQVARDIQSRAQQLTRD